MNMANYFTSFVGWKKYVYPVSMSVIVCCIFLVNANHLNEQSIYLYKYLPLAENILNISFYSYNGDDAATYPMWGYPGLLAFLQFWNIVDYLYYIQFGLAIISLVFFLKLVKNENFLLRTVCSLLFIFYAMLLSVKWPDAIMAFLVFMTACSHINKKYLLAGVLLGIAYNFRSESLVFLLVYVAWVMFNVRQFKVIFAFIFIVPWIVYGLSHHGHFIPTTTNSGGVLYISLGQLPENMWERKHLDGDAESYVWSVSNEQISDPWGYEGGRLLKAQFLKDIQEYPVEFVKKLIFNTGSVIVGGLYTVEARYFFFEGDVAKRLIKHYRSNKREFMGDIISLESNAWVIAFDLIIKFFSCIFFLGILAYCIYSIITKKLDTGNIYLLLIILQLLLTVFIQYQPRHISHVIILFVFILISTVKDSDRLSNEDGVYR